MIDVTELPHLYSAWRARYTERDLRMETMASVVAGDLSIFDPDEEALTSRSPNFIQVALEDTAEAASLVPTVRVQPERLSKEAKDEAAAMEQIAAGYMDINEVDLLIPQSVMDLGAFGMSVWTIMPDFEDKYPRWSRRDPRTCYPEPDFKPGSFVPRKVMFTRELYFSQLPEAWQLLVTEATQTSWDERGRLDDNTKVHLVELFDDKEILIAGMVEGRGNLYPAAGSAPSYLPVELKRVEHKAGVCPVVIGSRITLDGEFRGQFDQVVDLLEAHIRLMSMVIDYADQSVYSDIWVRDLIGEMPWGGGAFIELGPNGAIGRVPPAVSSLNIGQDLQTLVDGIHMGGRWPKSRPGEIDQSIASAKFLEASAGMMNTAIRTYHQTLQRMLERAIRISYMTDKAHFKGKKRVLGILRNQEFLREYDASREINLKHRVRVEYGLGLGRDPAQSAVLHIQYAQNDFISKEFVQENIDGLSDVAREQRRIDMDKLRAMAFAKLLQGIQEGGIPDAALVAIAKAREKGDDLFEIFEEFVVKPQEDQLAQQLPTGLGAPAMPGAPPPQPGAQGGPPGAAPPAPPGGADLLARLNVPAGPGGLLGTQQTNG